MAHIAERLMTYYFHILEGTEATTCPDPTELTSYLREVRPEHFLGVPRVWEKIYAGISAAVASDPEKQAGLERALEVGQRVAEARLGGEALPADMATAWEQVDNAVFANLRSMVGLD